MFTINNSTHKLSGNKQLTVSAYLSIVNLVFELVDASGNPVDISEGNYSLQIDSTTSTAYAYSGNRLVFSRVDLGGLTSGTRAITIYKDGTTALLDDNLTFKINGGGGSGSSVEYIAGLTSGTLSGDIVINGSTKQIFCNPATTVSFTSAKSSGDTIGDLTINGTNYTLYCNENELPTTVSTSSTYLWNVGSFSIMSDAGSIVLEAPTVSFSSANQVQLPSDGTNIKLGLQTLPEYIKSQVTTKEELDIIASGGSIAINGCAEMQLMANSTLNAVAGTAGYIGTAMMIIKPSTFTLTAGSNLTIVNELEADKTNQCLVTWYGATARLVVIDKW